MAHFSGTIKSKTLQMDTHVDILLPFDTMEEGDITPVKVLYLLHGQGSNCSSWMRWTSIARYAQERNIAVVMPEVQRSFYLDMAYGLPYKTYVAQELPKLCETMFHISSKPEDKYIAGLSMGGYGAMRIGFENSGNYAGIASMSGLCDIKTLSEIDRAYFPAFLLSEFSAILGENLELKSTDDIYYLAKEMSKREKIPKIFTCCGLQDDEKDVDLYKQNIALRSYLEELSLPNYKYMEWDGLHNWKFWDEAIVHVLDYFLG